MDWSEETISRLRQLWDQGISTTEIGRLMGVTKNVVIGKAHRLNLPGRPSPIIRDGRPKQKRARRRAPANTLSALKALAGPIEMPPLMPHLASQLDSSFHPPQPQQNARRPLASSGHVVASPVSAVSHIDKENGQVFRVRFTPIQGGACLWPLWAHHERPTHLYCGEPQSPNSPYCENCCRKAYTKINPDRVEDYLRRLRASHATLAFADAAD